MKFEKLDVWKRSASLASQVYKHLETCRDFGFKQQITRSCLSVSSNIAEGWERNGAKERARFLEIAKGSLAEFVSQAYIGAKIGYIDKSTMKNWNNEAQQIAAMLGSLRKTIENL